MVDALFHEPHLKVDEELTALIMNCPELAQLEARLAKFNIFRVLKADKSEIRHSNMLAWLLSPTESHGLEDFFLRRWLMEVMHKAFQDGVSPISWVSPILVDVLQIRNVEVFREYEDIDLLLAITTDEGEEWIVCIENKVNARQSRDQLKRYRSKVEAKFPTAKKKFFIFLTKNLEEPADDQYLIASYSDISRVLDRCLSEHRDSMGPDPLLLIQHYQSLLLEDFVEENESTRLAREIYKRHSKAIDFILESKRDPMFEITNILEQSLRNEASLLQIDMSRTGKGRIRFLPTEWNTPENTRGRAWGVNGHYMVLEIDLYGSRVDFSMIAGRAPDEWTDKLWELCATSPFQRSQKTKPQAFLKAYKSRSKLVVSEDCDADGLSADIFEWVKGEMSQSNFALAKSKITELLPLLKAN